MAMKTETVLDELFDMTQKTLKLAHQFERFDPVHVEVAAAMACMLRARRLLAERAPAEDSGDEP